MQRQFDLQNDEWQNVIVKLIKKMSNYKEKFPDLEKLVISSQSAEKLLHLTSHNNEEFNDNQKAVYKHCENLMRSVKTLEGSFRMGCRSRLFLESDLEDYRHLASVLDRLLLDTVQQFSSNS